MRIRHGIVAVLMAGLTTLVAADEPRKPGATGVFVPGPGRDLSLAVLSNKRLQEALKFTAEQRKKLTPLAQNFDAAQKAWRANRRKDKATADAAYKAAQAESKKGVEAILTTEQAQRLTQIERQVAGLDALLDDTNAKALKLTDEQRGKVREALRQRLKDIAEARRGARLGIVDAKVLQKIDEAAAKEVNAVLTDGQKKAWKELVGERFDTTGFLFQPIAGGK